MASHVAAAFAHSPEGFVARFAAGAPVRNGVLEVEGLTVRLGLDIVLVATGQPPSASIEAVLQRVESAFPGLREASDDEAVGLDGGQPGPSTTFDDWTAHWVRGDGLADGQRAVVQALFGGVAPHLTGR